MGSPWTINVADPNSWPPSVLDWACELAGQFEREDSTARSRLLREEPWLRQQLHGHSILVTHCTRLLGYEADRIRRDGLELLSASLVDRRISQALERGYLTAEHAGLLRSQTVFALGEQRYREDQVCLSFGPALEEDPAGCAPLLSTWGGEAIYWALADLLPWLGEIGIPSVVVATIDGSLGEGDMKAFPGLGEVFVGAVRGSGVFADLVRYRPVPPQEIVEIWEPGCPEYDRYEGLPRA